MILPQKSSDIGMKRGRILSGISQPRQLDIIAEGLPILLKSAAETLAASRALNDHPRAASILKNLAMEEVGKILILMDIVRCPPKLRPSRIGQMMVWFYDHLARQIYVDAQGWRPVDVRQLQRYVDDNRSSHYLEGAYGEFIMPNWTNYRRESRLYADIVAYEDGELVWNEPDAIPPMFHFGDPTQFQVCEALAGLGAFSREGLNIVSSVWGQTNFLDTQEWSDANVLTQAMLVALQEAGLIAPSAQQEQVGMLYRHWQLPMYHIDFRKIDIPLEDLEAEREANFWREAGY